MPSVSQACFAALLAVWSVREISPDLLQCAPLVFSGYEAISKVSAAEPGPVSVEVPPPPAPEPPIPRRRRKAKRQDPPAPQTVAREDVRPATDLWEVAGAHVVSFLCFAAGVFLTALLSYIRRARQGREQQRFYRDMGSQTIGFVGHPSSSSSSSVLSTPPASVSGSPVRARKGVYGGFHSA